MADIRHLLHIKAQPKLVYGALTTAAGIRRWWTDNADLEEIAGGRGVFRFHYGDIVETVVHIVNLQESVLVEWEVLASFRSEQNGTLITFELRPEHDGTVLNFSQTGYIEPDETYAMMNTGWAYYLVSLQQYLETGQGAPNPHINFGIMTQR